MKTITEDGTTELDTSDFQSIIYVEGDLGGGAATVGYINSSDEFVAYTDGTLAIDTQYKVEHGLGAKLAVNLTGSTSPTLTIDNKVLGR